MNYDELLDSIRIIEYDIKTNMYNQSGGKINHKSLECVVEDFKGYLKSNKPDKENNLDIILNLQLSSIPLNNKSPAPTVTTNFEYFTNDLNIVMDYTKFIMESMSKYLITDAKNNKVKQELDSDLKAELSDLPKPKGDPELNLSNLDEEIESYNYSSLLLKPNGNKLDFVEYKGSKFCRCKLVKDLIYFVILCNLLLSNDEKINGKQSGGSVSTLLRGTDLSDFVESNQKKNGNIEKGTYNIQSDNTCLSNSIITVIVLISDILIETANSKDRQKKILKSLKENSTTSTTDICSNKQLISGKFSRKIQGGMLKKLTDKLCKNAEKLNSNKDEKLTKAIKLVKSTFDMKTFMSAKSIEHFTENISESYEYIIKANLGTNTQSGGGNGVDVIVGMVNVILYLIVFAVSVFLFAIGISLMFSVVLSWILNFTVREVENIYRATGYEQITIGNYLLQFYLLKDYNRIRNPKPKKKTINKKLKY
jgi:hypothetical protein